MNFENLSFKDIKSYFKDGQEFWLLASSPSYNSIVVAFVFGSLKSLCINSINPLGSCEPQEIIPLGRWYLNDLAISFTPFAIKADASVSP